MSRHPKGRTITVPCPHILGAVDVLTGRADPGTLGDPCERDIVVPVEVDGGGLEGQDADGNRGYWVTPSLVAYPEGCRCPYHPDLAAAEIAEVEAAVQAACDDWRPPEPDDEVDA